MDPSTYLDGLVEKQKVPGIQYLVVDSTSVLFEHSGGWADIAEGRPMSPSTTLMAYSMSKTFTAAATLRLASEGALDLDDPVSHYVDDLPYGEDLTVRQLIAHTGGVPTPIPLRWAHPAAGHADFEERAALWTQLEKNPRLKSEPGVKFAYSNLGYWLLGPVVERASGQSFVSYVEEEVVARLGASPDELSFRVPDPSQHATGYLEKYSLLNLVKRLLLDSWVIGSYDGRWLRMTPHYVDGPAFGGLVGTANGFGRFLQDQLRPSSVLFDDATRESLYRLERTTDGNEVNMTLGWHVGELEGQRHFFKEGGGGGFHTMMRVYPEWGIATVVLTNATAFDVRGLLDELDPQFRR